MITFIRHCQRDKGDSEQRLTRGGQLTAFVMGREAVTIETHNMRFPFIPNGMKYCSPQPRSRRTAQIFMSGLIADRRGPDVEHAYDFTQSPLLDDYSSDKRPEVMAGITSAKELDAQFGMGVEAAMFLCPEGQTAIEVKLGEAMQIVEPCLADSSRDHLLCGLHGCTIDALYVEMIRRTRTWIEMGPGAAGGLFDYGEGFSVRVDQHGKPIDVELIRQPAYLKAALAAMGE